MAWQYKVVYVDFRGRVSIEGEEIFIAQHERRSSFARRVMNTLGAEGWELVGIQPLWPAETAYMMFKKEGEGDHQAPGQAQSDAAEGGSEAPTTRLPQQPEGSPAPQGGDQARGGQPHSGGPGEVTQF